MTAVAAGGTVYSEADSATDAVGEVDAPVAAPPLLLAVELESLALPSQPASSTAMAPIARIRPSPAPFESNFIRSRLRFGSIPTALRRACELSISGMTIAQRLTQSMRYRQPRCLTDQTTLRPEALRPRLATGLPFTLRSH